MRNDPQDLSAPNAQCLHYCCDQIYGGSRLLDDGVDVVHVADARHAGLRSPSKSSMGSPARRATKRKAGSTSAPEEAPPAARALAKVGLVYVTHNGNSLCRRVVGFCGFALYLSVTGVIWCPSLRCRVSCSYVGIMPLCRQATASSKSFEPTPVLWRKRWLSAKAYPRQAAQQRSVQLSRPTVAETVADHLARGASHVCVSARSLFTELLSHDTNIHFLPAFGP